MLSASDRYLRSPCKGGAFPVSASPPGRTLQPEVSGAVMEVTKWLKPSVFAASEDSSRGLLRRTNLGFLGGAGNRPDLRLSRLERPFALVGILHAERAISVCYEGTGQPKYLFGAPWAICAY